MVDADASWKPKDFDAVVVASGHYHAPRIPDIPGLAESKAKWPSRIQHSKAYRRPSGFEDKVGLFQLLAGTVVVTLTLTPRTY